MQVNRKPHPRYPDYLVGDDGSIIGPGKKVLKPMLTGWTKGGRKKRPKIRVSTNPRVDLDVGAMVLETFVGPRPDSLLVLHADDDPSNNALSNLRYGTFKDNARDMRDSGNHSGMRLNKQVADEIKQRRAAGETGAALAQEYGVTQQMVCNIHKGRAWT